MKVYLNKNETHLDPRPHNDILWGLKAHCDILGIKMNGWEVDIYNNKATLLNLRDFYFIFCFNIKSCVQN